MTDAKKGIFWCLACFSVVTKWSRSDPPENVERETTFFRALTFAFNSHGLGERRKQSARKQSESKLKSGERSGQNRSGERAAVKTSGSGTDSLFLSIL